jgi:hypothetical protein
VDHTESAVDWPIIGQIKAADDHAASIVTVSFAEDRLEKVIKTFLNATL